MGLHSTKFISFLTQALFLISVLSGAILVFAYHPSNAYESIQKLNYIIPFGLLFRQIHYFSSEAFFISILVHIVVEMYKNRVKISFSSWNWSVLGLFVVVILMFTGFVLKADFSANSASEVAFSLIKESPILDNFLPLFQDLEVFYWKFFIWHILFLPTILTFAIYKHTRRIDSDIKYFTISLGITLLLTLIFLMPIDIPLEAKISNIEGPWFFWGAERLLQLSVSAINVNLILSTPFLLLVIFYKIRYKLPIKILLIFWVLMYAYLSF